jgi:hypothetical protein
VNAVSDTAAVAVLGGTSLLSTAFAGGTYTTSVTRGQTISVPVVLDMSRVSTSGDLGAAQLDLTYDPAALEYLSAQATATGSSSVNSPGAGTVKFSYAHTAAHGSGVVTLVTLTFQVPSTAVVGRTYAFSLVYVGQPTSTTFAPYGTPIAVGGRIRIVAP